MYQFFDFWHLSQSQNFGVDSVHIKWITLVKTKIKFRMNSASEHSFSRKPVVFIFHLADQNRRNQPLKCRQDSHQVFETIVSLITLTYSCTKLVCVCQITIPIIMGIFFPKKIKSINSMRTGVPSISYILLKAQFRCYKCSNLDVYPGNSCHWLGALDDSYLKMAKNIKV